MLAANTRGCSGVDKNGNCNTVNIVMGKPFGIAKIG